MLTRIYHKKNELFEVNFYKDKECTDLIDLMRENLPYPENAKISDISNFYIDIEKGDITPITFLLRFSIKDNDYFYTPYLQFHLDKVRTFYDITPNLSKYIPENNNVIVFLSEEGQENYQDWFPNQHKVLYINDGKNEEEFRANNIESLISGIADVKKANITIFLTNGTETELQKANEVAKELTEKYGVNEINLFILHCFVNLKPCWLPRISYLNGVLTFHYFNILTHNKQEIILAWEENGEELENNSYLGYIDTIITTNSTKIAYTEDCRPELENKFKILDCYDIFNDYLQNKND